MTETNYRPIQFPRIPESLPDELRRYFAQRDALIDEQVSGMFRSIAGGFAGNLTFDGNVNITGNQTIDGNQILAGNLLADVSIPLYFGFVFSDAGDNKVTWTTGKITYQNLSYTIEAETAGNTEKYIYWDKAATPTTLHTTNTFATAYGTDKYVVCINDGGTPYPCSTGQPNYIAADGSIDTDALAAAAVATANIANDAIDATKLAVTGIDGTSGNVSTNHIAAGMIQTDAITAIKILAGAITTAKIDALAVVAANIAAGAIETAKLAAGAVTAAKMTIKNFLLSAGTFTDESPTGADVAWADCKVVYNGTEYTITNGDTSDKYIYWQLASPTVFATSAALPVLGVSDFLVAQNDSGTHTPTWNNSTVLDGGRVKANTITASEIKANSITASQIAATTITAAELAADSVTATKIDVTDLAAVSATLGNVAIDGAKITNATITSAKIGDLQVGTSNIANNAATNMKTSSTSGTVSCGTSYTSIASVGITTAGGTVEVTVSFAIYKGANTFDFKITQSSTIWEVTGCVLGLPNASAYMPVSFTYYDTPGSGAKTYSASVLVSYDAENVKNRVITVKEFIK